MNTTPSAASVKPVGVRIAGSGICLPDRRLNNADLEKLMDTTDEWITQRTGISERRVIDRAGRGESTTSLGAAALQAALDDARIPAGELDLVLCATMTADMPTPGASARIADLLGATPCGAFDLNAACSGFVYGLATAHSMIKVGAARTIGFIGVDTITRFCRYDDTGRSTAILFGDAAGAVVLRATDDLSKGEVAHRLHSDGGGWKDLYIPAAQADVYDEHDVPDELLHTIQMNGRAVFKFAVGTFQELIAQTLDDAGIQADDVDMYVCHQSNARILAAARDRFGLPEEKLYINIDRFGNTVAASVPLCFHELVKAGRIREGQLVMFVAFGAGLTWAASLWRI